MKNLAAERDTLRRQNSDNNSYATSFAKKTLLLNIKCIFKKLDS